eukprot:scaffold198677_cov27-Tisochrysis_lutea.AAC.1
MPPRGTAGRLETRTRLLGTRTRGRSTSLLVCILLSTKDRRTRTSHKPRVVVLIVPKSCAHLPRRGLE